MSKEITNSDDVIDSRDIIARIEALEADPDQNDESETEELRTLKALAEQCEGYGDWEHGEGLISASYFTEYVEELLKDIGDLPQNIPHYIVIDWEATAENVKADYMTVDFDGQDYLMRA